MLGKGLADSFEPFRPARPSAHNRNGGECGGREANDYSRRDDCDRQSAINTNEGESGCRGRQTQDNKREKP
jgi:hypothetical protein